MILFLLLVVLIIVGITALIVVLLRLDTNEEIMAESGSHPDPAELVVKR